ncbi:hypothetical protein [Vulcaniibacterium tengchongense]|uniref:Uncharacterized protein n=1 Tax=Vulcaniibacterium tengchongense TaxID=1273429 RepID=A0A3N4UX03_9GAMM|nr:hypothetical protein [Vulcaniibacterium tengchongense]RPE74628.1 hypothetical protein EDC50_3157 [Vulcaniibacterium tengchongense]
MAKGYRSGGVDFDDLFDPDVIGDGPAVPNLRSGGAPLRYAALKYGQKRADVGYRQDGVDVSSLWAAKGTAVYKLSFDGISVSASNQAKTNSGGTTTATALLWMHANGTWEARRSATGGGNNSNVVTASGTWIDPGAGAAEYQVLFEQVSGTPVSGLGLYDFTASRAASLSVSVRSQSSDYDEVGATVKATLRRNGRDIRTAVFGLSASAAGWV